MSDDLIRDALHDVRIEPFDPDSPGRFRYARCSCGWESHGIIADDVADAERTAREYAEGHRNPKPEWSEDEPHIGVELRLRAALRLAMEQRNLWANAVNCGTPRPDATCSEENAAIAAVLRGEGT